MASIPKKIWIVIFAIGCLMLFSNKVHAADNFSVTVPMELPITMDSSGQVTTAQNAAITNNSSAAVKVSKIQVDLPGWTINQNLKPGTTKADSKEIALWIEGNPVLPDGSLYGFSGWGPIRQNLPLALTYDARLPAQSADVNEVIGHIIYTFISLERITDDGNYIFNLETGTIIDYIGREKSNLTIPAKVKIDGADHPVKTIGESAFQNKGLTGTLRISQGIETIEADAFRDNRLGNVKIPNSVSIIGDSAFRNNRIGYTSAFENVEIDNYEGGIENLASNAFNNNVFFGLRPARVEYLRSAPALSSSNDDLEQVAAEDNPLLKKDLSYLEELYFIEFDQAGNPVFDQDGYLVCDRQEVERLGYLDIFIAEGLLPLLEQEEAQETEQAEETEPEIRPSDKTDPTSDIVDKEPPKPTEDKQEETSETEDLLETEKQDP